MIVIVVAGINKLLETFSNPGLIMVQKKCPFPLLICDSTGRNEDINICDPSLLSGGNTRSNDCLWLEGRHRLYRQILRHVNQSVQLATISYNLGILHLSFVANVISFLDEFEKYNKEWPIATMHS